MHLYPMAEPGLQNSSCLKTNFNYRVVISKKTSLSLEFSWAGDLASPAIFLSVWEKIDIFYWYSGMNTLSRKLGLKAFTFYEDALITRLVKYKSIHTVAPLI